MGDVRASAGRGTAHGLIEGAFMDWTHPAPDDDPHRAAIAERNIVAVISRAMGGGETRATCVLLRAEEATVRERLAQREIGSQLTAHIERSLHRAAQQLRPARSVSRPTAGRSVQGIAVRVIQVTAW
jgi:hypothetical protein